MPRPRTEVERAAGELISVIQKVWGNELGNSGAKVSEEAMHISHEILQASKAGSLKALLAGRSISEYIGETWVRRHSGVRAAILALEKLMNEGRKG